MAHAFESGFVVREPAWHGLADVIPDYITDWEEAREAAGLDWEVVEHPVFARYGSPDDPKYREIEGHKGLSRSDGGLLSIQKDSFEPFLNGDLGPLLEALVGEDEVQYETAGSLKEGRKVWVLVRLRDPIEIPGDPNGATLPRLAVQNSHDGSGALRAQALMTRIVCDNTSRMADVEAERNNTQYVFRHTKNIYDYVEQAKQAVQGLKDSRQTYLDWANDLLGIRVTPEEEAEFISLFFPEPPADVISDRVRANIEEARNDYRSILAGDTTPGDIRDTGYALVQGAVEYLQHWRGARSQETRFNRTYLAQDAMQRKAEDMVRAVTGNPR